MRFTRNNRRKTKKKIDKTTADILAGKQMLIDNKLGYETVTETYEEISKKISKAAR